MTRSVGMMLAAVLLPAMALPAFADGMARPVRTAPVHFEERQQSVTITGEVVARVETDLSFRVGGRIFATLASIDKGFGNLMLTPEIQAGFVEDAPEIFLPVAGGWGRMGATHIRLAAADREVLTGALRTAWQLRVDMNQKGKARRKKPEF